MDTQNLLVPSPIDNVPVMPGYGSSSSVMKKNIIFAVCLIIFLLVGMGVFAYIYYINSPKIILARTFKNLSEVKSLEYSGKLDIKSQSSINLSNPLLNGSLPDDSKTESAHPLSLSLNFTGGWDGNNPDELKASFNINVDSDIAPGMNKINLETKSIGKDVYFHLGSQDDQLGFFMAMLGMPKDQWLSINIDEIREKLGIDKILEEKKDDTELTKEQKKQVEEIIRSNNPIKLISKSNNELLNEIKTYYYNFSIDKDKLLSLLVEVSRIRNNKAITDDQINKAKEAMSAVDSMGGELWIGKKDHLPYKFSLSTSIKETAESKTSGTISFAAELKNFNKPVIIEKPESVKSLNEIIAKFNESMSALKNPDSAPVDPLLNFDSPMIPVDPSIDSDNDGLDDDLEAIYGTDKTNPDTDGDGYKDIDEINSGYNPNGPGRLF